LVRIFQKTEQEKSPHFTDSFKIDGIRLKNENAARKYVAVIAPTSSAARRPREPIMQSVEAPKGRVVPLEHYLRCARDGDNTALGQLLGSCEPLLRVIVEVRWLKGRAMNENYLDLMQETLMRGYRDFADFRGATLPQFLAWLAGFFAMFTLILWLNEIENSDPYPRPLN
jgi:hypothetical protein